MKTETNEYGFRKDFDWNTRFDLKTDVGDYQISTVDLGLDHSFGIGEPLYYETMIFLKENIFKPLEERKKNIFEDYQERYSTEDEAKKGHKRAIDYVKNKLEDNNE